MGTLESFKPTDRNCFFSQPSTHRKNWKLHKSGLISRLIDRSKCIICTKIMVWIYFLLPAQPVVCQKDASVDYDLGPTHMGPLDVKYLDWQAGIMKWSNDGLIKRFAGDLLGINFKICRGGLPTAARCVVAPFRGREGGRLAEFKRNRWGKYIWSWSGSQLFGKSWVTYYYHVGQWFALVTMV